MSALPRPKRFVNTTVWITCCFLAGQLFLHARHTRTEGVLAGTAFWLWGFQPGFPRIGLVVGGSPFGVQTAFWVLAFLARPCLCLSHYVCESFLTNTNCISPDIALAVADVPRKSKSDFSEIARG